MSFTTDPYCGSLNENSVTRTQQRLPYLHDEKFARRLSFWLPKCAYSISYIAT